MPFNFGLEQYYLDSPYLQYFGRLTDSAQDRAAGTTTGQDELKLIIRSLMILELLADNRSSADEVAEIIAEGFVGTDFSFNLLNKPKNMVANINYLRGLLSSLDVNQVKELFPLHDAGKCIAFIQQHQLAGDSVMTSAAHDSYLDVFLSNNPEIQHSFNSPELSFVIKLLDVLGHSPHLLQAPASFPSLKLLAELEIKLQQVNDDVTTQKTSEEEASRKAFISVLVDKAKSLNLDSSNIEQINPQNSFHHSSPEQQREVAFLMWTGGLRIAQNDVDSLRSFQAAWNNPVNEHIVQQMTQLLINNLEQTGNYCLPYNVTGLLHKTDDKLGLKGFLTPQSSGGMGGTFEELLTVFFPFILEKCQDPGVIKHGTVGHNTFQVQQLIEVVKNTIPDLAKITQGENNYPSVDFGDSKMNNQLWDRLTQYRNDNEAKKESSAVLSSASLGGLFASSRSSQKEPDTTSSQHTNSGSKSL